METKYIYEINSKAYDQDTYNTRLYPQNYIQSVFPVEKSYLEIDQVSS
jgi:hypothetical protein